MKIRTLSIWMLLLVLILPLGASAADEQTPIVISVSPAQVNAGDQISMEYEVKDNTITIIDAAWIERIAGTTDSTFIPAQIDYDAPSGSCTYKPKRNGTCWFIFKYRDQNGKLQEAKSATVEVNGLTISISVSTDSFQIPVGQTVTVEYTVTGGSGEYTVSTNWDVNNGVSTQSVDASTTSSATGALSFTPAADTKFFNYFIIVLDSHGASEYVFGDRNYSVISVLAGDVNGDGKVDGRDLLRLARFLAGQNVEINEKASDVNADGKVDGRDLLRIARFLAGQNVELRVKE